MQKPINKFAVALWVAAALVLIGSVIQFFWFVATMRNLANHGDTIHLLEGSISKLLLLGAILPAAQLSSFGVLIELVDQIRWNALRRTG